jgi:signal transduction histidine kinase
MGSDRRIRNTLFGIVALAGLYAAIARLGLSLGAVSGFATLVWPAGGMALGTLVVFGLRLWPGVYLGAFAVNVWVGAPIAVALGIALGNTLEAVLGALILQRVAGSRRAFDGLRSVLALIIGAAAISTLVSATIGVLSLSAGGVIHSTRQQFETWRAWWVGDVLGDLVVAPLVIAWLRKPPRRARSATRALEAVALTAVLLVASCAIFLPFDGAVASAYILFPPLVWAALRFEMRGATLATAGASIIAIWGTATGTGPFVRDELSSSLLALETFMGCAAITALVVAGVTMDRARAVQANDTFIATLSHDLKSPLQAMSLSGDRLALGVTEQAVDKHLDVLRRAVGHMSRLIADLLDVAAIEGGRLELQRTNLDIRSVIDDAVALLRPVAAAKRVELVVAPTAQLPVSFDRARILQVLANVLGNAIKFSPAETAIEIAVDRVELAVRIAIRDCGPGIPRANLQRVFDRNWHVAPSHGGGSGMGLFIAKSIVEAHGGEIWVRSQPGSGSSFYFTLPLAADSSRYSLFQRWLRVLTGSKGSRSTGSTATGEHALP